MALFGGKNKKKGGGKRKSASRDSLEDDGFGEAVEETAFVYDEDEYGPAENDPYADPDDDFPPRLAPSEMDPEPGGFDAVATSEPDPDPKGQAKGQRSTAPAPADRTDEFDDLDDLPDLDHSDPTDGLDIEALLDSPLDGQDDTKKPGFLKRLFGGGSSGDDIFDDDDDFDALADFDPDSTPDDFDDDTPFGSMDDPFDLDGEDAAERRKARRGMVLWGGTGLFLIGTLIGGWLFVASPGSDADPDQMAAQTTVGGTLPSPSSLPPPVTPSADATRLTPPDAGNPETTLDPDRQARSLDRRAWLQEGVETPPEQPPAEEPAADQTAALAPDGPSPADAAPDATPEPDPATTSTPGTNQDLALTPLVTPGIGAVPSASPTTPATAGGLAAGLGAASVPPEEPIAETSSAFSRPLGELIPSSLPVPPPQVPVLPLEEGFRPGQMPRFSDLPQASRFGPVAPLPDAPLSDLLRPSQSGQLPIIAQDGRMPWRTYARPFTGDPRQPRIAVIVIGLGLRDDPTAAAITGMHPDVTLAFDPYSRNLAIWLSQARQDGHETLLSLPVEGVGFPTEDVGPLALRTVLTEIENSRRLDGVMGRAGGYVGLIASAPGNFTDNSNALRPVLEALKTRGLLYVHRGSPNAVNTNGDVLPAIAAVTRQIDAKPFSRAIDAELDFIEDVARAQGFAVAVTEATPLALFRVARWIDTLPGKGIALAPVSAMVLSGSR